jgi:hypothetical protein
MSEDIEPVNDNQITAFITHQPGGEFAVGFVINDPDNGPIIHQRIHNTWAEAKQAEAELLADLF